MLSASIRAVATGSAGDTPATRRDEGFIYALKLARCIPLAVLRFYVATSPLAPFVLFRSNHETFNRLAR